MSAEGASYGRLQRVLDRVSFTWGASGTKLAYVAEHGLWMNRFRPGGPHALWIAGHLAFYEGGARKLYQGLEHNPLGHWKDLFANGSECYDEPKKYPDPEQLLAELERGRQEALAAISGLSDAQLDSPVVNERLKIRDLQSQIEFMVWHDAHHDAQLGAIVNNHKATQSG